MDSSSLFEEESFEFSDSHNSLISGLSESSKMSNVHTHPGKNFSDDHLLRMYESLARYTNYTQQAQQQCSPSDEEAFSVANRYKQLHGYIALIVCIFGAIANCLIMVVLRRKEMRTPVNAMLFFLAIADLLIMVEYIPFALHRYVLRQSMDEKFSYSAAAFVLFHVHFTQILHTISIQLTLSMAIWRYVAIKCSNRSSTLCTLKRCYQVIAAAYICPLFFCILNYFYFQIVHQRKYITAGIPPFDEIDVNDEEKKTIFEAVCNILNVHGCNMTEVDLYVVQSSDYVKEYPILHTIHFWTFSVMIKLIPCFVLTFFMVWMVNTLYKARRHHKMLENKSALPLTPVEHPQTGEMGTVSPNKGSTKGKLIHPENMTQKNCGVSPSRSIRFAPNSTPEKDDNIKSSLLGSEQENGGVTLPGNQGHIPQDSLTIVNSPDGGHESRRTSGGSGSNHSQSPTGFSGNVRRFTKSFIRLPSIRRHSHDKGKSGKGCKRTDRTSKMLIAVLVLFLLTEFPQGIMHFITGWYGPEFLRCKYNPWAEVWDIVALINSAINFILYCFMSKQFRTQFQVSFSTCFTCPSFRQRKWATLSSCNNNQTVSTTV